MESERKRIDQETEFNYNKQVQYEKSSDSSQCKTERKEHPQAFGINEEDERNLAFGVIGGQILTI